MGIGHYPSTILEACQMKKQYIDSKWICGGTDVMVTKNTTTNMIFLNQISQMQHIVVQEDSTEIGAAMTYAMLLAQEQVPEVLKQAIRQIASPAIRNMGTIGGNIGNASPAGDTLPVLYALDAQVKIARYAKELECVVTRQCPIDSFITGVKQTALAKEEVITAIVIPRYNQFTHITYEKVGARQSEAISKVSFVGLATIKEQVIEDIRIAFGAVGKTVVREKGLEQWMCGKTVEDIRRNSQKIMKEYEGYLLPIDDQRSTAIYRKKIGMNLLKEFTRF